MLGKEVTFMGRIPIDPALTEHDSLEEAEAYDAWFRAEVQAGLDEADAGETVPHDQAVAEMRARIEERRKARSVR
nr:antitoxin [Paraburkholderia sp. BL8N3]